MKYFLLLLLCSSVVFAQRQMIGQTIEVQGINQETPKSTIKTVQLEMQKLLLETSAGQISILGYPSWLVSQRLIGTTLTATQRLRPDGSETRLEFARTRTPFLLLGAKTSPNAVLIGNWRFTLQISERTAFINSDTQTMALPLDKNVLVKQGLLLWCVRLAALHLPAPNQAGVANEAENPRFDWAALRVSRAAQCL
jgi:hypothetical protein